jgi:flagellar biosynthesis protein
MSDRPVDPKALAIALHYEQGSQEAPRVVAKGRGRVAEKIVALAEENGVIIETNPVLAEALSGVELDETIPVELYEAMAVVIGYVLRQTRKSG